MVQHNFLLNIFYESTAFICMFRLFRAIFGLNVGGCMYIAMS